MLKLLKPFDFECKMYFIIYIQMILALLEVWSITF